jgi:multiple sugar transport system permease protein
MWYPVVIVVSFVMISPLLWMIFTSLKPSGEVLNLNAPIIPSHPEWSNIVQVWHMAPFGRFFLNSVIFSVAATLGQIITSQMAGYAFARINFPGKTVLFYFVLSGLMIPFTVVMVPVIQIVHMFGWINTFWGLIIPNIASAFGAFLYRQFFFTVPGELGEAATVDGASPLRIFVQIYLPLAKPMTSALAVLSFLANWNNFLFPLLVTNTTKMMVLPLGLSIFQSQFTVQYNLLMSATLIVVLPIFIVSLFTQRYIVDGLAMGAVK